LLNLDAEDLHHHCEHGGENAALTATSFFSTLCVSAASKKSPLQSAPNTIVPPFKAIIGLLP